MTKTYFKTTANIGITLAENRKYSSCGRSTQKGTEIIFFIFTTRKKDIPDEIQRLWLENQIFHPELLKKIQTFGDFLLSSFDDAIDKSYFATALKLANILKKQLHTHKYIAKCIKRFRQKIVKCFVKRLTYMDNGLSKTQGSSRKGYNTQYYLLKMLEKWKSALKKRLVRF